MAGNFFLLHSFPPKPGMPPWRHLLCSSPQMPPGAGFVHGRNVACRSPPQHVFQKKEPIRILSGERKPPKSTGQYRR